MNNNETKEEELKWDLRMKEQTLNLEKQKQIIMDKIQQEYLEEKGLKRMPGARAGGPAAKAEVERRIKEDKRLDGIAAEFIKMEEERQKANEARAAQGTENKAVDTVSLLSGVQGLNTILDYLIVDPVKGLNEALANWILGNQRNRED